jgi:transposase InsO family protein
VKDRALTGQTALERTYGLGEAWRGLSDVELATLQWVDWFNKRRIHESIGYIPPAEAEARYYANPSERAKVA